MTALMLLVVVRKNVGSAFVNYSWHDVKNLPGDDIMILITRYRDAVVMSIEMPTANHIL
jgi:hypothetical protein